MGIFCIGQSAYDITVPLEEDLIENRKYRVTEYQECGGGPALNAAYLCALWGADVQLISRLGDDRYGNKLRAILKEVGVGTDWLIPDRTIETPYSLIIAGKKNGKRTIFNFPGVKDQLEYELPSEHPDVILSDGHEPEITLRLIEANPQAISVVDAGTMRESTMTVAKVSDYLVCSEDFARQYTGKQIDLEDREGYEEIFRCIEDINHKYAVITLGERGLLYRSETTGMLCRLPAYPVQAVDTSGAGDIFHGAFSYGLYKGDPLEENLKRSSMAAAISVQYLGSQTSIPRLELVEERLKEY